MQHLKFAASKIGIFSRMSVLYQVQKRIEVIVKSVKTQILSLTETIYLSSLELTGFFEWLK